MSLWLHLYFPCFPLEVVSRVLPVTPVSEVSPIVVIEGKGARAKVIAVAEPALDLGLAPGMSLGRAWGLAPGLTVHQRDLAAETRVLDDIASWAMQFSSLVAVCPPMGVSFEIRGSLSLFGGLDALVSQVREQVVHLGFSARIGIAPTPLAACLLAVEPPNSQRRRVLYAEQADDKIVDGERLANRLETILLDTLSVAMPDLPARTIETLKKLGLKTLGECEALPRKELSRRVKGVVKVLDRIYGRVSDPQLRYEPPLEFSTEATLPLPTNSVEALLFALNRLYQMLAGFLASRAAGVNRLTVMLRHRGPYPEHAVTMRMATPTRDPMHLIALTRERLERLTLKAEVDTVALKVDEIALLDVSSGDLFLSPGRQSAEQDIGRLIERLGARLGQEEVHRLAVRHDHRPEYAWASDPIGVCDSSLRNSSRPDSVLTWHPQGHRRPLWLLVRPALLIHPQDGFGPSGPITLRSGPERIESGWWDDAGVARDYYVARNAVGETLWVFEDRKAPGYWYLHGRFG